MAIRREDGGAVAIQCKFYAPTHRIQKKDIDSFPLRVGRERTPTESSWKPPASPGPRNAEQAILDQQIPVTRIGLTDLRNSDIDWASYQLTEPDQAAVSGAQTLRDHQASAITDVFKGS